MKHSDAIPRLELLAASPYFKGLGPAELKTIDRLLFEKRYRRDEMIVTEGQAATALYFVAAGAVKVFKTSADGKEQILSIVRPQEAFNEVPVFNGGINPAGAQAMTPVVLYGLDRNDVYNILKNQPQVALNIIGIMAQRLRHLVSLVEELSFKRVISRVAGILLEYAGDGVTPGTRLTQREMAAMAGTAREVVARSLKTLEEDGVISIAKQRIVISDRKALQQVAGQVL